MPQPFSSAVMTDQGAALLTIVQSGVCKMEFTRMAVGDGIYADDEKTIQALQQRSGLKSLRNAYALSSIEIHNTHSVKITALISNQDQASKESLIEEGYYINEIGLFARETGNADTEILYSIAVTTGQNGDFMPPYNGFNPVQIIQDYYATVNNAAEVTIQVDNGAVALAEDLLALQQKLSLLEAQLSKMSRGKVRIGPADTQLELEDTLFIVEGMLPENFEAASYSNMVFSAAAPEDAQYWAETPESSGATADGTEVPVITNGKLAVSKEADAPDDTAFLAKIN